MKYHRIIFWSTLTFLHDILWQMLKHAAYSYCFGQCLQATGTMILTSPYHYYSYNFLLLETILPFQTFSSHPWNWTAVLLCSTSEDFGISSAGVRWQLLLQMGSKCGSFACPVGIWLCVCVYMSGIMGIFSSFTETSSIVRNFLFSFLPFWHSLK